MKTALITAAVCIGATIATKGVDYSTAQSLATHQCWKNNVISLAIPRAWRSQGDFDSNAIYNVRNARSAGIPYVDIYMFPCAGKSAVNQVADLVSKMSGENYGQIWLDIETNPSTGCGWSSYTGASNCQFVTDLVNAVKYHGRVPGIYSNYYMWESIMGSAGSCPGLGNIPLWYAHYDGVASFSDWRNFGGWTKPNIKQYIGDTTLCGAGVDYSWYP